MEGRKENGEERRREGGKENGAMDITECESNCIQWPVLWEAYSPLVGVANLCFLFPLSLVSTWWACPPEQGGFWHSIWRPHLR